MKVAFLNTGGALGGAERNMLDVIASLRASRPDVEPVVLLGDDGHVRPAAEAIGARCVVLPLPGGVALLGDAGARGLGRKLALAGRGLAAAGATLGYRRALAGWLRSEAPDLVQTNGMKMHLLGAWSAPKGVPILWQVQDYLGPRAAMARLLRMAARDGVHAAAITESVAEDVRATLRGAIPVTTAYSAVDLDEFAPGPGDGPALDRDSGLGEAPSGTVRVGLIATFATWKGHEVFLEAASRISADRPARFYVVGGPIYRSTGSQLTLEGLRATAARLGLAGRVGFPGHQADPARAIRSLDVVVHASIRPEPFGRVIVEGMASGRAVVAMSEGGAAELFEDGRDALGCPPRDPVALADRIDRLIGDEPLRRSLGERGRASAVVRFDRSRLADAWGALYDRIVRDRRPSPTKPAHPGPTPSPTATASRPAQ